MCSTTKQRLECGAKLSVRELELLMQLIFGTEGTVSLCVLNGLVRKGYAHKCYTGEIFIGSLRISLV